MDEHNVASSSAGVSTPPRRVDWSATDAIAFGWNAVTRDFNLVLALFLAMLVGNALLIVVMIVAGVAGASRDEFNVARVIAQLVNAPISIWVSMGLVRYMLKKARGQGGEIGDLFSGGPFLSFLGAALVAGLLTLVGLVALIVPGIIISLGLQFYAQEIIDRRKPALRAIADSWELTKGHKGGLFAFALLSFVVNIAGMLVCLVGVFFTLALTTIAGTWIYLRLIGEEPPEPGMLRPEPTA